MKKIKLLLIMILISILSTGCSVEYNLTISSNTIKEEIIVNDKITSTRTKDKILAQYNKWYPTYINYITSGESIPLPNYNTKYTGVEYYDKSIEETSNGYKYKYQYAHKKEKYYDAYVLANTFFDTTVYDTKNNFEIFTSQQTYLCQYDYFETLNVNVTVDTNSYRIIDHNADKVKNNVYSWTINRDDCEDGEMILSLGKLSSKNGKNNNKKANSTGIELYVFCFTLLILVIIGYFIIKKKKQKLDDFDIDD